MPVDQHEVERLRNALTPSAETKAAYIGEFSVPLTDIDENGEEYTRRINVPWTTIKEVMSVIRKATMQEGREDA